MIVISNNLLYDTSAIMYVLGCLIQKPELLSEIDKIKLTKNDFDDKLTKLIYLAVYNLYINGANKISPVEIESYLNQHSEAQVTFKEKGGFEYVIDAVDVAHLDNFYYYYNRVKKFSALRDLEKAGHSIKKIYDVNLTSPEKEKEMVERFDQMTVRDIFDSILKGFVALEHEYVGSLSGSRGVLFDGMEELRASLKKTPEVGFELQGKFLNTVLRGARKTKFYIRSGATGTGKTRLMVGDACGIAFPFRYDKNKKKWMQNGFNQKILFVTTEMSIDEIQTMVWAYLADVNEEKILFHHYEDDEEERVNKAIDLVEKYKDNFFWEHIPDPTIETVTSAIRNQVRNNEIEHVFYDYIFSSPSLLKEFERQNIREDVILGMFSTKLKDLANELDVFMSSATQMNGTWENEAKTGIRNQNMIRGSKAIIDKGDAGYITLPIMPKELEALANLIQKKGYKKPTHVTDIYKLRRGRYKDVRIWSLTDLGTCRVEDLFVTDAMYNEVSINILEYQHEDWGDIGEN